MALHSNIIFSYTFVAGPSRQKLLAIHNLRNEFACDLNVQVLATLNEKFTYSFQCLLRLLHKVAKA